MRLFGFTPTGMIPTQQREVAPVAANGGTVGVPSTTAPDKPQQQSQNVTAGNYAERIAYVRGPEQALQTAAWYRGLNLRGDTMSVMPVQLQKRDYEKGNYVTDMRGLGKRINYILQEEANPIMTAPDLWKMIEINRVLFGNSFAYVERDDFGFPVHLWLVKSGGFDINNGRYINVTYLTDDGYRTLPIVNREDILHFANTFRYQNGIWGIPTLAYAITTLSLNRTLQQQALETAAKGGKVKLIIGEEKPATAAGTVAYGMFDKKQMDDYAQELQKKMYSGHDILAIRGLDKVQNISMNAQEMQMFEQLGGTNDDIARYLGIPRPLLMLDTNSHYNDYQNATMEFHTRTILPQKTGNEKEIARKLIGFADYGKKRIHICEKPLLAMDPERQAKVDQLNLQTGAMTVNEIRAEHDMPTVENGNEPMASANLLTLKALIAKSEGTTTLEPGNYTVNAPTEE